MRGDYFSNHPRAMHFPWSIYHRPLEESLAEFLSRLAQTGPSPRVLVVGAGFLHELPVVPLNVRLTATDIDERVVSRLSLLQDVRLEQCVHVREEGDLPALGPFEGVYAKEVIEHLVDIGHFIETLCSSLRPGGTIWVSTPNYGDPWLPLVESTVLELIGRMSGYSRRDMHPNRFTDVRLRDALQGCGLEDVRVARTRFRLALVGTGRRPLG